MTKNRLITESRAGSTISTNTWLARVAKTLESEDCGQDFARVGPLDVKNWHLGRAMLRPRDAGARVLDVGRRLREVAGAKGVDGEVGEEAFVGGGAHGKRQ